MYKFSHNQHLHQCNTFVTAEEPALTHHPQSIVTLGVTVGVVYSIDLYIFMMTYV